MSRPAPTLILIAFLTALVPLPASALWAPGEARQVVMFGVLATPDAAAKMDPKISPAVAAQLRKSLPGHSFKLIKVKSERVAKGATLACDLGVGFVASAMMLNEQDQNGKVQMRFDLSQDDVSQFQTIVVTPPDQFNFFDKMLPSNNHLLLGVGAR